MDDRKNKRGWMAPVLIIAVILLGAGLLLNGNGLGRAFAMMGGGMMNPWSGGWGNGYGQSPQWNGPAYDREAARLQYEIEQKRGELGDVLSQDNADMDRARKIQQEINELENRLTARMSGPRNPNGWRNDLGQPFAPSY